MYDLKTNEAVTKFAKKDSSGAIPMARMCTGSGLSALAMETMLDELNSSALLPDGPLDGGRIRVKHVMVREVDDKKQKWIDSIAAFDNATKVPDVTLFGNARCHDWCSKTMKDLDVPSEFADAGFSRKDLSSLSEKQSAMIPYIAKALTDVDRSTLRMPADFKMEGSTLPTLLSVMRYLIINRPALVFLENVAQCRSIWPQLLELFHHLRYVACLADTHTCNYLHPASRERVKMLFGQGRYLPGLRSTPDNELRSFEDLWNQRILEIMARLKSPHRVPLESVLLPCDSPELLDIVTRWSDPDMYIGPSVKWPKQHDELFKALGNGVPGRPGPAQRTIFKNNMTHSISKLMFEKQLPRQQDIWIYSTLKSQFDACCLPGDATVDISQTLGRTHIHYGISDCLTGSSVILLLKAERILVGQECLVIQGLTSQFAPHMLDHSLCRLHWSLAGNSYAAGSAMAAMLALFESASVPGVARSSKRLKGKQSGWVSGTAQE